MPQSQPQPHSHRDRSPYRPTFREFEDIARDPEISFAPVYRQLTGDGLTPVTAFRKLAKGSPSFLFESVVGGEKVGRYSFLGTEPFLWFEAKDHEVSIAWPDGREPEQRFTSEDPLRELQRLIERYRAHHWPALPRFCGGAVGYASYDAVRYSERLPNAPADDRGLPDLAFGFYDRMVIFDHIRKTVLAVAMARLGPDVDPRASYEEASRAVDELAARLAAPSEDIGLWDIDAESQPTLEARSNMTQADYEDVVRRCQEYIKAGDIFQVVPSQRFQVTTTADPFRIYRVLRVVNPSPFLFYLDHNAYRLIGCSPEIMTRYEDGYVTVRPLAGTRRRGRNEAEDQALEQELLADPKEIAEHVMLIDLGRNDVGRVSEPSTVELTEIMKVERYSHVMHISSNVRGKLAEGMSAFDALRACLPVGTVTGAPKVRAMEIIDEMEPTRRGPYAGAVGYVDYTGNMDTCIALRTIVMMGQEAYIQVGAGVVYDSVPSAEYAETVAKAKGMLKAIEIAEHLEQP